MASDDIYKQLYENVLNGDFEQTGELANKALENNIDPMDAINSYLVPAIELVGERFGKKEYFLPDLMRSANAMKNALEVFEKDIREKGVERKSSGKVVIGTVKGDIHEIGKSIVASLLTAKGFTVTDLGVDVESEVFINKIVEEGAEILAMSALLPITMPYQGKVIEDLKARGLRDKIKIMVGGSPVTQEHAERIGADGYADDAVEAVKLAERLMKS
ncbi:MAG: cobalamin-binding protein [Actinobacteria bacterium]|nr:cobalamin-binding protein [Actinomycetota bacterium]